MRTKGLTDYQMTPVYKCRVLKALLDELDLGNFVLMIQDNGLQHSSKNWLHIQNTAIIRDFVEVFLVITLEKTEFTIDFLPLGQDSLDLFCLGK